MVENGNKIGYLKEDPAVLFDQFKKSSVGSYVAARVFKHFREVPFFGENIDENKQQIASLIFEQYSYWFIKDRIKICARFLNPDQTAKFFSKLDSNINVQATGVGRWGAEEYFIPDGLLFDYAFSPTKPVIAYEYTLSNRKNAISSMKNKYQGLQNLKEQFPTVFQNTNLSFVVPDYLDISPVYRGNVFVKEVPLEKGLLEDYISYFSNKIWAFSFRSKSRRKT